MQLLIEVIPLVVEVKHSRVLYEQGKRPRHKRWVVTDHEVQNLPMIIGERDEKVVDRLFGC